MQVFQRYYNMFRFHSPNIILVSLYVVYTKEEFVNTVALCIGTNLVESFNEKFNVTPL